MSPPRRLAAALLALGVAAFLLWLATRLVWLRAAYQSSLRGPVTVDVTGAVLRPELAAIALLAVAAAAAVVATSGWPRRVLGALVAAAGAWAVRLSWVWGGAAPAVPVGELSQGGRPGSAATVPVDAVAAGAPVTTSAALLGLAAGLLLVLAGIGVVCWADAMPRLGARYSAPGTARRVPDRDSQWWDALDAGEDPTLKGPPGDPGTSR
ncbi:MAG TPA: Trp biosynthesis-associated membrane protein [Pseudonocardia sp.]|nr:Trp biosynthesis-associated membrane protein [Pseudonocardia sp.]